MIGNIDIVENGRVLGWIYDETNNSEDICVKLLIDGRVVSEAFVTEFRKDVSDRGYGTGLTRFSIPFTVDHHFNLKCSFTVVEAKSGWQLPPGRIEFNPGKEAIPSFELVSIAPHLTHRINHTNSATELFKMSQSWHAFSGSHLTERLHYRNWTPKPKTNSYRQLIRLEALEELWGIYPGLFGLIFQ